MDNVKLNIDERIDYLGINDLKVIQNSNYFCFGIDSVLLANFVESNNTNNYILDLCSGGGVIPILLSSKIKYKKIAAIELQNEMFDLLTRNVNMNGLNDKIDIFNYDINDIKNIRKVLLEKYKKDTVDIITVNPPYKIKGTGIKNENEVKYIARHEVKCTLDDIFSSSSKLLNVGGKLYIVHKPQRLSDLLLLARKYNLEAKQIRLVYPKKDAKPSIVLIQYTKNGGNELNILPPLIEYNDDGSYTDEIYKLYGWKEKNDE